MTDFMLLSKQIILTPPKMNGSTDFPCDLLQIFCVYLEINSDGYAYADHALRRPILET